MKKVFVFGIIFGLMILALTACAPIADVLGAPEVSSASGAQDVQSQYVPVVANSDSVSAATQKMTSVQLVYYAADRSIRTVTVNILLDSMGVPAFTGLLPTSGMANDTVYLLDSTGEPQALAVNANGVGVLSFIQKPASYGLAVWPGSATAMARLAWASGPSGTPPVASLQISALDGSQFDTAMSLDVATLPLQLVPEVWSADGEWLYFSQEPTGLGGYTLFSGASNLYMYNITTTQVKELIARDVSGGAQVCLDAISVDFRYVADHCSQNVIAVRDLVTGETTTIQPPDEVSSLFRTLGSARFSPDGSRVAFALARRNPDNEQGWVAVSDGLSGESTLILTSQMGSFYTVAGWLDSQTLLVQSTDNMLDCNPYCVGQLWTVRVDGSNLQKVVDGRLITVITGEPRLPDNLVVTPVAPTQVPPTPAPIVPTPTQKPVKPTAVPVPCNLARFVKDVTVKDGTVVAPGDDFTKTWRLENAGTCTWTKDYDLVFRSGDQMDGAKAVSLGKKVLPGETIDISVDLTAPMKAGEYTGYWALRDDGGRIFGIGADAKTAFWVTIKVKAGTVLVHDFTTNYCNATWSTNIFPAVLCPTELISGPNIPGGTIRLDSTPWLETGYNDDEVALITYPDVGPDGYIRGHFPAIKIEDGDHFRTIVGCMYESSECDVTMILSYSINGGSPQQLGKWTEVYDEEITRIDIDLSFLAGKKVEFIFTTRANGINVDDYAFWLMPRIVR